MSLTNCPECGNRISTQAHDCPKCGYPMGTRARAHERTPKIWKFQIFLAKLLLLIASIVCVTSPFAGSKEQIIGRFISGIFLMIVVAVWGLFIRFGIWWNYR